MVAPDMPVQMEESQYRRLIDDTFRVIDAAFEDVDPDLAESVLSQGTLTVTFADGRRLILSPQTPVRQLWVAFRDRAWHLDYVAEPAPARWLDDRGQNVELHALVEQLTRDASGVTIAIGAPRAPR
jgi:CyaY protein